MPQGVNIEIDDNPPLIRFEKTFVRNQKAMIRTGKLEGVNQLLVFVRGHGDNKNEVPHIAEIYDNDGNVVDTPWAQKLRQRFHDQQISENYLNYCLACLDKYKQGEVAPTNGTPLTEWAAISKWEVERLHTINIFTIEELSRMTDDAMQMYGMGAQSLKLRSQKYMQDSGGKSELEQELAELKAQIAQLTANQTQAPSSDEIDLNLDDDSENEPNYEAMEVPQLVEALKSKGVYQAGDHWKKETLIKKLKAA